MLRKLYSQAGQDYWAIHDVFGGMRGGYFVDIGAADGKYISNTYALERRFKWSGLCVEADPTSFEKLKKNRSCRCVNVCLDSEERDVVFTDGQGLYGGIVDDETDNASLSIPSRRIKTETLAAIMQRYNSPQTVHYLSVDVEGAEERVLAGFPFQTHRFLAATIERPSRALRQLLSGNGYLLVAEMPDLDAFYIHPSMKSSYTRRALIASQERSDNLVKRLASYVTNSWRIGLRETISRM
ncbi:MAG: FkbM family methyltransferase [Verrucomicrobiaceae bacterium]|nr:MAG: FkbM family methyltransferase [Verrucomicrobiaceae bacterium]